MEEITPNSSWAIPGVPHRATGDDQSSNGAIDSLREQLIQLVSPLIADSLSDEEFTQTLRSVAQLKNAVDAALVTLAHETNKRTVLPSLSQSLPPKYACSGDAHYFQTISQLSRTESKQFLNLAKALGQEVLLQGHVRPSAHVHLTEAFRSGLVTRGSARMISQTLSGAKGASAEHVAYAEKCLVEAASGTDLGSGNPIPPACHENAIQTMCSTWDHVLNPDGSEPSEAELPRRRFLTLGTAKDGLVPLKGLLEPQTAAILGQTLHSLTNPKQTTTDTHPDETDALPAGDDRTPGNLRHDAFAALLNLLSRSDQLPSMGGSPVTVMIQTTVEDLQDPEGYGWMQSHHGNPLPVGATTVHQGACAGAIQHISMNRKGKLISQHTTQRGFTSQQRRAITVRDGGCVIPGCTIPSNWCEVHHVLPHADGGHTKTSNGVLLCWYHHRTLSSSGWLIRMKGGVPQTKAPPWTNAPRRWSTHRHPQRKSRPPG